MRFIKGAACSQFVMLHDQVHATHSQNFLHQKPAASADQRLHVRKGRNLTVTYNGLRKPVCYGLVSYPMMSAALGTSARTAHWLPDQAIARDCQKESTHKHIQPGIQLMLAYVVLMVFMGRPFGLL